MDIRELRYFIAAFEERSVTAAARRCTVSQPSVSAAIASLEAELGAVLFVRHKKGVSPTAAGERLYPVARRIAEEELAARSLFRQPQRARRITLGLMRTLDIARTLDIIAPLTRDPDLHVRLVGADQACDARVVSKIMVADGEEFAPLWVERYVVALPARHPLAARERVRGADLVGARLIDRCYCEYADLFARASPRFDVVAIAPSEEWALAMVGAGLGIAILPEGVVARRSEGVVVRPIADAEVTRQVGLAYGARGGASPEVQSLVARLRASHPAPAPPRGARRRGGRPARPARLRAR
ncbi:MAG TPA: LysR family transcriptional regulator [Kofleriaceae bacterium]|nr:LysR family transcriptional regulator [Kofleriaceae bacterium]